MTTIIACRRTQAMYADSLCSNGTTKFSSRKIDRIRGHLVGAAGDAAHCEKFLLWYAGKMPLQDLAGISDFQALVLTPTGILYYEDSLAAIPVSDDYYAIGSGSQAALASLETMDRVGMPYDPELVIEIVSSVDPGTGMPVQVMSLAKPKRRNKSE